MDIVERLRRGPYTTTSFAASLRFCNEVADEIERLRLQLENAALASVQHEQEWRKAEAERDALRHERDIAMKALEYCAVEPAALHPANNAQFIVAGNALRAIDAARGK